MGVVIELGPGCTKLKLGDVIFGCAPVGQSKSTSFQDTFVIDEKVFLRKPDNVTLEEASTIGVGLLVCCLDVACFVPLLTIADCGTGTVRRRRA